MSQLKVPPLAIRPGPGTPIPQYTGGLTGKKVVQMFDPSGAGAWTIAFEASLDSANFVTLHTFVAVAGTITAPSWFSYDEAWPTVRLRITAYAAGTPFGFVCGEEL